jgi:hypothetical protein
VGRRHRARGAVVEKAGASLPGSLEETGRHADVEEVGASHPSSVGSASEASNSDMSTGNRAGVGGAHVPADAAEQPWASDTSVAV